MGTQVVLRGLPARAFVQLNIHIDDVVRELELAENGARAGPGAVPVALGRTARQLLDRCAAPRHESWRQAELAATTGRPRVDVVLDMPRGVADCAEELESVMEQADELSRVRHLLVPPPPGELLALRRWLFGEITAQVR
ncbi:MAG: hypothetical protein ACRDZW_07465, partial [Acidimicrobiales bacterium]